MKTITGLFGSWKWKKALERQADERQDQMNLMGQIKECEFQMRRNEQVFNMQIEEGLIDALIYERESLRARHGYLMRIARASGQIAQEVSPDAVLFSEEAFAK